MTLGFGQERLVLPGQELLYPNLTDPSFTGEEGRTQITALGQFVDFETDRSSLYLNAQLPIYDNLSFGVDYFKNKLDFYNYSYAMLSAAFEIPIAENNYIKIGLSGGAESVKLNQIPAGQPLPNLGVNFNENNIEFTYKAGLHYTGNGITLGGYYITLPAQDITRQPGQDDLLNYELSDGFTAYLGYRIRVGQRVAVTPMFRYLSYIDEPIYEGGLKFQFRNKFDLSMAYRNDYSINPALRFQFFKSLLIGYSYEKAMGKMDFDDIHSFSLSYKFNKANAEDEPEWMKTAQRNIEKTNDIKKSKPKKEKKIIEKIVTEEVTPENEPEVEKAPVEVEVPQEVNQVKPVIEEKTTELQEAVELEEVKRKNPFERAVIIEMSSRFYLVAKSFDRYHSAIIFKKELEQKGVNALIGRIENDKKFYVYVDSDSDEKNAKKRMVDYKSKDLLKDIFLVKAD